MGEKRVVITGLGIISPHGVGKDVFIEAIMNGVSGIKPISLFDASPFRIKTAGEVNGFDPSIFLGNKGLRTLDRSIKLLSSSAYLALNDAKVIVTEDNTHDIGVVIASTLGSVCSISEFDKTALLEGVQYVNPALFPNTVINSPASQISIKYNIKGFNTTISTGSAASLDTIQYAADFLRLGRAKIVLAGGVEELCIQTFLGFYNLGLLAGLRNDGVEISCPFDKRRNGIVLGEAAGVLVLEELESAQQRGAHIYAEVVGYGQGFRGDWMHACRVTDGTSFEKTGENGLYKSMCAALTSAHLDSASIDYISAAANSTVALDAVESKSIQDVFGEVNEHVCVSAIKSMTGECFSSAGILQVVAGIAAIERQCVPPTINYCEKDSACVLNYVVNNAHSCNVKNVLINASGFGGASASLVVSRCDEK